MSKIRTKRAGVVGKSFGMVNLDTSLPHAVTAIPLDKIEGGDVMGGESLEIDLDQNGNVVSARLKRGVKASASTLPA